MKKIAVFALSLIAAASQAIVLPAAFFPTPAPFQENFDSIAAGVYNNLSVFGSPANMTRLPATGGLVVRPFIGANTAPNVLYGDGCNVRLNSVIPMRRFGGFFRTGVNGVISPTATFRFYDAAGNPIGQQTVLMTTTFQWFGFQTFPKWRRVEILGGIPGFPGAIGMDTLRMRIN